MKRAAIIPIFFSAVLLAILLPWMAGTASAAASSPSKSAGTWVTNPSLHGATGSTLSPTGTVQNPTNGSWQSYKPSSSDIVIRVVLTSAPPAGQTFACMRSVTDPDDGAIRWWETPLSFGSYPMTLTLTQTNFGVGGSARIDDSSVGPGHRAPLYWFATDTNPANEGTVGDCSDMDPGAPIVNTQINPPMALCPRTLSQNNGENIATFRGSTAEATGANVTGWSWDFGDTSTTSSSQNVQHIYPALSTMPQHGWTATLTVSYTAQSGYEFPGAQSTATATCQVRIDFLNPTQTTPLGTEIDGDEDADCPTGFGWLNPLAIIQILKCLFIPSAASVDNAMNVSANIETKAPFSYAYEVVMFPGDVFDQLSFQFNPETPNCMGQTLDVTGTDTNVDFSACANDGSGAGTFLGSTGLSLATNMLKMVFLLALAFGVYQLATRVVK